MAVVAHTRMRWAGVPLAVAFPSVAVIYFLWLALFGDAPIWGAVVGAIVVAVVVTSLLWLWRLRAGRWAWLGLGLGMVVALPLSVAEGLKCCRSCGEYRRYLDLGWGVGHAWVRMPCGRAGSPTHALADFYEAEHRHVWGLCSERMVGVFFLNTGISGGHLSHGDGYRNRFSARYEEDGEFRALVAGKISSGQVTPDQVRLLLGLPLGHRGLGSVPPGTHALVKMAGAWMGEDLWYAGLEKDWPPESPGSK